MANEQVTDVFADSAQTHLGVDLELTIKDERVVVEGSAEFTLPLKVP